MAETVDKSNTMNNILLTDIIDFQMDMSPWELLPELILLILVLFGIHRVWSQKKNELSGRKPRSKRKKKSLPLTIKTPVTQPFTVKTLDISLSGAFLDYKDLEKNKIFMNLLDQNTGMMKIGDLVDVEIPLGHFKKFSSQARLIRFNFSDQTIPPKGMAIEFVHLNENQKRALNLLIFDGNRPDAA